MRFKGFILMMIGIFFMSITVYASDESEDYYEDEFVEEIVYDEGEEIDLYCETDWLNNLSSRVKNLYRTGASSYTLGNDVVLNSLKRLSYYKVDNGVEKNIEKVYNICVTNGDEYVYSVNSVLGNDGKFNGKILLDSGVTMSIHMTDKEGNISKRIIKTSDMVSCYVDFQKVLMKITDKNISSIKILFGGNGKVYIYGPYRVYSNTIIRSNYSENKETGVRFIKAGKNAMVFTNVDDTSSKNYISPKALVHNDFYRAGKNISFENMFFDIDYTYECMDASPTNVCVVKMIHASDINVSGCKFEANCSKNFRSHIIEFTAVKDSKVKNCLFEALRYENTKDDGLFEERYFNAEAFQIESGRWSANPFGKFPDPFYTDVYKITGDNKHYVVPTTSNWSNEYNKSFNIQVDNCKFVNVPNCVGSHYGRFSTKGSQKGYDFSSDILINNCDFINSKIAIHLRGLRDVEIKNCHTNNNLLIRSFSERVRSSNKITQPNNDKTDDFVFAKNIIFN